MRWPALPREVLLEQVPGISLLHSALLIHKARSLQSVFHSLVQLIPSAYMSVKHILRGFVEHYYLACGRVRIDTPRAGRLPHLVVQNRLAVRRSVPELWTGILLMLWRSFISEATRSVSIMHQHPRGPDKKS